MSMIQQVYTSYRLGWLHQKQFPQDLSEIFYFEKLKSLMVHVGVIENFENFGCIGWHPNKNGLRPNWERLVR